MDKPPEEKDAENEIPEEFVTKEDEKEKSCAHTRKRFFSYDQFDQIVFFRRNG